jgi:hypothetical protein
VATSNTTMLCRRLPPTTLGMMEPGGEPMLVTSIKMLEASTAFFLMASARLLRRHLRSTTSILRCRFYAHHHMSANPPRSSSSADERSVIDKGQAKRPAPYLACQLSWFLEPGDNKICVRQGCLRRLTLNGELQGARRWICDEGVYWFRPEP